MSLLRHRWIGALLAAGCIAAPGTLRAEEIAPDCAATEDPAQLFRKGKDYYAAQEYDRSYYCYKKSWDLRPSYDVAGNLGNVELKHLGRHADAATHLRYALDHLPGSLDEEARARIAEQIREMLSEALAGVAAVTFVVEPPAAEIVVDGVRVGQAPLEHELYLEPGEHRIVARLAGHRDATASLTVKAGTARRIELLLQREHDEVSPPPSPVAAPSPNEPAGPILPLSVAGLALGGGALVAGGVLVGLWGARSGERDDRLTALGGGRSVCTVEPRPSDCDAVADLDQQGRAFGNAGIALLIGGGALVGATLAYHLWPRDGAATDDEATVRLRVFAGGVALEGSTW
jgi:hypothetical protein